ncbi:MAG: type II toxin-antitoxin system RelE/ParE family toxin [Spirochaetales bacterium]
MEFLETSVFTRLIDTLLDSDQYRALQDALILRPEAGDLIQGTVGLRKVRWGAEGRGKRGGLRVIYYFKNDRGQIYFLYAYPKHKQEDLSVEQRSVLTKLVKDEWK